MCSEQKNEDKSVLGGWATHEEEADHRGAWGTVTPKQRKQHGGHNRKNKPPTKRSRWGRWPVPEGD